MPENLRRVSSDLRAYKNNVAVLLTGLLALCGACNSPAILPALNSDVSTDEGSVAASDGDAPGIPSTEGGAAAAMPDALAQETVAERQKVDNGDAATDEPVDAPQLSKDTPGQETSTSGAADEGSATDTSSDASCKDPHQFGDFKVKDNSCWGPPKDYCSNGCGQAITKACNPTNGTCCDFGCTCVPCGWTKCNQDPKNEPAVCAKPSSVGTAECEAAKPNYELVICWDGMDK